MPTDVISKIGQTNSPTTMDYSTLQSWEDASPANLVTDDKRWIGECYDQGTLTAACLISGNTVDSTRYAILRCATGASFKDKSGVRTNALLYNTANGVSVQTSGSPGYVVRSEQAYTQITGLQVKASTYAVSLKINGTNATVAECIGTGTLSGNAVRMEGTTTKILNSLVQYTTSSGSGLYLRGGAYGCTIVNTAAAGTSSGVDFQYNQGVLKNCTVFGFSTFRSGTTTPAAGSDYNATDMASAITGSNNVTSLTFADQFVSTTTDFRAVVTGGLKAGTPDATNTPNDITGLARDATTPYIGCWEVAAAAPAYQFLPIHRRKQNSLTGR